MDLLKGPHPEVLESNDYTVGNGLPALYIMNAVKGLLVIRQ